MTNKIPLSIRPRMRARGIVTSGSLASSPKAVGFSNPTRLKIAIFTPIAIPASLDPLRLSWAVLRREAVPEEHTSADNQHQRQRNALEREHHDARKLNV